MATTYELIVKAVDKTSSPLSRIERNLKRVETQAKRTGRSMNGVGGHSDIWYNFINHEKPVT